MIDLSQYKTKKDLEEFTKNLYTQVQVLQEGNDLLNEKLTHAEELLKNSKTIPVPGEDQAIDILKREIKNMDKLSKEGGLTIEETRQLKMLCDCLVGFLRVRNGQGEDKPKKKKHDVAKLLQMVNDAPKKK